MPQGDLLAELGKLYRDAGRPSYRSISFEIRRRNDLPDTVSHETVGALLTGKSLPGWRKVESVVRQLADTSVHRPDPDAEVRRFHLLWSAAMDSQPEPPGSQPAAPEAESVALDDVGISDVLSADPSDAIAASEQGQLGGYLQMGSPPARNPGFTGRRDLLGRMAAALDIDPWRPLVLHGLGGVGKSQLAAEYLYEQADRYDFVWWIRAEDPSQATGALAALGERQEWPASLDMAQTVRTVLTRLEDGRQRWLLVYDNARTPDEIQHLLPQASGHLVVTTRDAAWLELGRAIEVDVFARSESVEFLSTRRPDISPADASGLADQLGDLPLALEQVAAIESSNGPPVSEYLEQLRDRALPFLQSARARDYRTNVAKVFTDAAEQVRQEAPATALLLRLLSCLGADPISLSLLRAGGSQIRPPLGRLLTQPAALDQAIWKLRRRALVKIVDEGETLQVHRLVQTIVRDSLSNDDRERAYADARLLLTTAGPGRPGDPLTWDMYARIGPHLRPVRMLDDPDLASRKLLIDQADYLYEIGDFEGSRRLSEDALNVWARHGIGGDEQEFACLRRVVAALYALGRYRDAHRLAEKSWERVAAHPDLGPLHVAALELADSLAVLSRVSGDYRKALTLDQDIVKGTRQARGDPDRLALRARNNLGVSLRAVGAYRAARAVDTELVEIQQRILGEDHQWTLLSVSNLARDLYGLGEFASALDLQRSTWAAYRSRLGDRHPQVLAAGRTIALGLRKTGRIAEALAESLKLVQISEEHLGSDHELTLGIRMTYANTLCAAGDVGRANSQAVEALDCYRRSFGERNPLTLAAATNQAIMLRARGDRLLARRRSAASFRALRQVIGQNHPYTVAAAIGFGNDLTLAREHDTAQVVLEGALDDARRVFGPNHPDTLVCQINLGRILPKGSERSSLLESGIAGLRAALGAEHPLVRSVSDGSLGECDVEPPPA